MEECDVVSLGLPIRIMKCVLGGKNAVICSYRTREAHVSPQSTMSESLCCQQVQTRISPRS